ncbi:MAG: hypothetical protein ABMA64_24585 [Myxococcota bacterium]
MGWDFTVTLYDEGAWREVVATAAQGLPAVRARLESAVPPEDRGRPGIAELEDADRAGWITMAFLVLAARGSQEFVGRSSSLAELAGVADAALGAALEPLGSHADPLLSSGADDPEQIRHRWPPDVVAAVAAHAERLQVPALDPEAVHHAVDAWRRITGSPQQPGAALTDDHPAVRALGRSAAEVTTLLGLAKSPWAFWRPEPDPRLPTLRLVLALARHARDQGLGMVLSHDDLGHSLRKLPAHPAAEDPTLPPVPDDDEDEDEE